MNKIIQSFNISLIIILFLITDLSAKGSLLIRNANLISSAESEIQKNVSILILNGRVRKIGKNISGQGIRQLDAQGYYVLPGLIDSHVHLMWGPGVGINKYDTPQNVEIWRTTWGKYILHYLRAYLACGVTTVLDASAPVFVIQEIRKQISKGNPGPRFLTLGQFFSPPKGYAVNEVNKPVSTQQEVEAKLSLMQSLKVTGIKIPIEKGYHPFRELPIHSPKILEVIRRGAGQRNLPIYTHVTCEEAFNMALDNEVHALMHTLIHRGKKQLSKAFIERMANTDTYQVTTLSIMDSELTLYNLDRLNEPLLKIVIPENELSIAKDKIVGQNAHKMKMSRTAPGLPKIFWGLIISLFFGEEDISLSLQNGQKAIYDLHKAGVPIVMGSDTVFDRFTLYSFHGFTSLREIELLGEAGLSPKEAIRSATVISAKMLGMDREIGTIETGKCADLIILKENPLNDLRAFRTIQWTIKDGIAKTPEEWMRK